MKHLLILIALAIAAGAVPAAAQQLPPVDATKRPTCTDGRPWSIWLLNESSATDCDTTAGGSVEAFCCCTGGVVASCASIGSTINSFATANAPSGTDPVADSSADTLNFTAAGGLTITGDSAADSLAFVVGNVATATALAANPADCTGAANEFAWRIAASGDLSCASVSFPNTVPASSAFTVDGANSVWGASSSTLVFEGATADAFETVLASGDPTGDRVIYLPDASGGLMTSTCSNCWADAASGLSGEAGVLVFEGSVADAFETRFYATNATADRFIEAPDATGYVMLSDCSTCSGTAANSVQGTTNGFLFEGTTANGFETTFTAGDATADRAIVLPDGSGTLVTSLLQKGVLLGSKIGANFNTTGDNAITMASTDYIIDEIIVTNASTSLSPAAGGVYSAAAKGGTVYVAAAQSYAALTGSTVVLKLTLAAAASNAHRTGGTIYLSLTTARGVAATADIYVFGTRWN